VPEPPLPQGRISSPLGQVAPMDTPIRVTGPGWTGRRAADARRGAGELDGPGKVVPDGGDGTDWAGWYQSRITASPRWHRRG
jgi:hypothetical protein